MGVFTSMMASKPFQYIKGMPVAHKAMAGAAVAGGLYGGSGRRGSVGKAVGMGALGVAGAAAFMNRGAISTFGRNMMRPGNARAYGSAVMDAGRGLAGKAVARGRSAFDYAKSFASK